MKRADPIKIARITTGVVQVPFAAPIGTAIHAMRSVACVVVGAESTDGVVGTGMIFALNGDRVESLYAQVNGLAERVVGRCATETEGIWADLWKLINPMGLAGVTINAMAAIDVALWDLVGRSLDMALHRLWGSCRTRIPTYASSGLWLSAATDELVDEANRFVADGFNAMKIRLGSVKPADDIARVRAVREAIGPDIELLADLNQGLDPKAAIRLGRDLEPFRLGWLEEPVATTDHAGHARVRSALDTPIATGETEYTRHGLSAMLRAGAADVLMPDLARVGGYTEFRKAAAIASAWHVPVSPHFFTEHSLALAGSLPNCTLVEHVDWFAPLFVEAPELVDGELVIPDRPGHGFTLVPEVAAGLE